MRATPRPGRLPGPRSFDPVVVGNRETDAWAAYYRREWARFLAASVGMVRAGFGMNRIRTVVGAWHVLRANQHWAPYPGNNPDRARESMRRFYGLVAASGGLDLDPARAAVLEVQWWRAHRAHQHDEGVTRAQLESALVDLYAYVYEAERSTMQDAARWRVEAMGLSDRWVAAGCDPADPLLAAERRALVASYTSLLDAVSRA